MGDACVAPVLVHPKATMGDASVLSPLPCRPRPYETNLLPCSFHQIPTLESPIPATTGNRRFFPLNLTPIGRSLVLALVR